MAKLRLRPTNDSATKELQTWALELEKLPSFSGRLINVVIKAGATQVTVQHGLPDAHRGAFVALATSPVAAAILPATSKTSVTVQIATALSQDLRLSVFIF